MYKELEIEIMGCIGDLFNVEDSKGGFKGVGDSFTQVK